MEVLAQEPQQLIVNPWNCDWLVPREMSPVQEKIYVFERIDELVQSTLKTRRTLKRTVQKNI